MFKPAHGKQGRLVVGAGSLETELYPDQEYALHLHYALGAGIGNYTYVIVRELAAVEVMKVISAGIYSFVVERAKDGTTAKSFTANATIDYILAAEAVQDIVQDTINAMGLPSTLDFTINAPHVVTKNGSNVDIAIQPAQIYSPDGTIDVAGSEGVFGISVKRGAFGCCD